MKKSYVMPLLDAFEVASEQGFFQSGFDSNIKVPDGENNGGEDDWA
jgi:hypothetical protein